MSRIKGKKNKRAAAEDRFYQLDNSAVFMAAIAGASGPFVFRLSCRFKEPIHAADLQAALSALQGRFPYFFVSLRPGVFWHYLDPVASGARLERDTPYPCGGMVRRHNRPLVRVLAYGGLLSCEFHHVVTDGTGAAAFLRALAVEYLRRRGIGREVDGAALAGIPRPGQAVPPEEEEDGYARYFRPAAPVPEKTGRAFLLPGRRLDDGYRLMLGRVPLAPLLAVTRELKVTLTEFLSALHIAALQDVYRALSPGRRRRARPRIALQIPVNLRKIYPSRTLRNFFLFAAPTIDLRLGHWEFEEILRRVHHQLRLGMEKKELLRQLKRNVGGERNPLGRPILLPLKALILRLVNRLIGVAAYSGSLSNLGVFDLPEPFAAVVDRFEFVPSRARGTGANVGVLTWRENVYVSVGSLIGNRDFERFFFRRLAAFGPEVHVESNYPDHPGVGP